MADTTHDTGALAAAVAGSIELSAASLADAVALLRVALAHDWTDAIPPNARDEYEHCWAQAFVARVIQLGAAAIEPSTPGAPLSA